MHMSLRKSSNFLSHFRMVRHGYDDDVSETKELNPKSQHCFDVSSQIPKRRSSGKFSLHFLVEKMNITYNSERKAPIP